MQEVDINIPILGMKNLGSERLSNMHNGTQL